MEQDNQDKSAKQKLQKPYREEQESSEVLF
jgi:hypothetical protein